MISSAWFRSSGRPSPSGEQDGPHSPGWHGAQRASGWFWHRNPGGFLLAQLASCDHPESREGTSVPQEAHRGAPHKKDKCSFRRREGMLGGNCLTILDPEEVLELDLWCWLPSPSPGTQCRARLFLSSQGLLACVQDSKVSAGPMRTGGEGVITGTPGLL